MSDALAQLVGGTAKVLSEKELAEKLEEGRPLRIKLGGGSDGAGYSLGSYRAFGEVAAVSGVGDIRRF